MILKLISNSHLVLYFIIQMFSSGNFEDITEWFLNISTNPSPTCSSQKRKADVTAYLYDFFYNNSKGTENVKVRQLYNFSQTRIISKMGKKWVIYTSCIFFIGSCNGKIGNKIKKFSWMFCKTNTCRSRRKNYH